MEKLLSKSQTQAVIHRRMNGLVGQVFYQEKKEKLAREVQNVTLYDQTQIIPRMKSSLRDLCGIAWMEP